ncbi:MAG TPA: phosphoglycerate dehydrogenase [Candidatus Polarisedimenticolia bacterium]|nr:phosphoglycerate dehydrogenase [Candidatus Polarisedimenticolia bacterium]
MKILIADKVSPTCADVLRRSGLQAEHRPGLDTHELLRAVADADGLVVRSDTRVTEEVIAAAPRLRVVGRAGAGVDNIDVDAATRRGIVVMNAPGENTISAAEHTMSMILALARRIPAADRSMRAGRWERGSAFLGVELIGKTLGILGLGKVGREVAARARAFGMEVIGADPVVSEEVASRIGVTLFPIGAVLEGSDFITLHLPLTPETRHLLGREALERCRPGVRIINVARGGIIDESALVEALLSGHVAGAALDVFESEPPAGSPLLGLDSVVLTPHLGASTQEAQEKVAARIAEQIAGYLKDGLVVNAVNLEGIDPKILPALQPYRDLCERLGRLLSALGHGPVAELAMEYSGTVLEYPTRPLTASFLKGFLQGKLSDPVNPINAALLARESGIRVLETRAAEPQDFSALVTATRRGRDGARSAAGTLFGKRDPRLVRLDAYHLDAIPQGPMLIVSNDDRPGMVGRIGTALGDAGVNIAYLSLGRDRSGGRAIAILNLDSPISDDVLRQIAAIDGVLTAERVTL